MKPHVKMGGREVYGMQLALAALIGLLLYLGLTPFDFSPENHVRWAAGEPGLHFDSKGIALGEAPLHWNASTADGMTLRFAVVPAAFAAIAVYSRSPGSGLRSYMRIFSF